MRTVERSLSYAIEALRFKLEGARNDMAHAAAAPAGGELRRAAGVPARRLLRALVPGNGLRRGLCEVAVQPA